MQYAVLRGVFKVVGEIGQVFGGDYGFDGEDECQFELLREITVFGWLQL
jgi:hypothetical protein